MIGPKSLPTTDVPRRWIQNSITRMTMVMGITHSESAGETISSPSTAEITDMAGVMTASP